MRWYFGMNEAATTHGVGLHARLAVQSALRAGGLEPVMLYVGARNAYTAEMEALGVRIVDTEPTFAPAIRAEAAAGRYSVGHMGHWLRTRIPLIEREHDFVVYTDCDVVFLRRPDFEAVRPSFLACAPEFRADDWRYFNSGVMVMNVAALRADYAGFEAFVTESIWSANGREFLDQNAYNAYYAARWSRLAPSFNWKTYWPPDDAASVLHFHGPKVDVMLGLIHEPIAWDDPHWRQLASLFVGHLDAILQHLRRLVALLPDMFPHARALIEAVLAAAPRFAASISRERVDLRFMGS